MWIHSWLWVILIFPVWFPLLEKGNSWQMMSSLKTTKACGQWRRCRASLPFCQASRWNLGDWCLGIIFGKAPECQSLFSKTLKTYPLKTARSLSCSASVLFLFWVVGFFFFPLSQIVPSSCRYHKYKLQFIHTSEMPYANTAILEAKTAGKSKTSFFGSLCHPPNLPPPHPQDCLERRKLA